MFDFLSRHSVELSIPFLRNQLLTPGNLKHLFLISQFFRSDIFCHMTGLSLSVSSPRGRGLATFRKAHVIGPTLWFFVDPHFSGSFQLGLLFALSPCELVQC